MKINISGFQGEGKTKVAEKLAHMFNNEGRSVRLIDGCNSFQLHGVVKGRAKLKVWDVTIRVRNIYAKAQD